ERLAEALPKYVPQPPAELPPGELDRLIGQLDANFFGVRLGAANRLKWLVARPPWACAVIERLKVRRRDPRLSAEVRQRIEPIWDAARRTWLASEPATWQLRDVSDAEIRCWIDDLAAPAAPADGPATAATQAAEAARQAAQQELLDLLVRDEYLPRVKTALEERLAAGNFDSAAEARFSDLLEWTRPMLVSEFWSQQLGIEHRSVQYLRVGEKNYVPGAANPCLFDYVDDRTAHCVIGNNLKPGNYRVGVLFPHPRPFGADADGQFRLVNLPTPRRRMAYEYYLKLSEAERFAELCRRTLDDLLAQKRPLKEAELVMLEKFDAVAVSRFACDYLPALGDPEPPDRAAERKTGRASPYMNLCNLLVEHGTRHAMPGLLRAMAAKRFPPLKGEENCDWPWLAALAIAQRDPWPTTDVPGDDSLPAIDDWLAGLIERTDRLSTEGEWPPELGATAAAILLERHLIDGGRLGVEPAGDHLIAEVGGPNSRFTSPAGRQKVIDWWREKKTQD
ncbi:MAG TPA: hypothetical protein VGX78_13080, partial [Pirellulales bacterium]|nr:hypothetical protein [Pirellulales bacterium]